MWLILSEEVCLLCRVSIFEILLELTQLFLSHGLYNTNSWKVVFTVMATSEKNTKGKEAHNYLI